MKRIRRGRASQPKSAERELNLSPPASKPTWQSVIADAEERMAELRRTIEWAKQYERTRTPYLGVLATRD
jgi:hypothetical protein